MLTTQQKPNATPTFERMGPSQTIANKRLAGHISPAVRTLIVESAAELAAFGVADFRTRTAQRFTLPVAEFDRIILGAACMKEREAAFLRERVYRLATEAVMDTQKAIREARLAGEKAYAEVAA